MQRTNGDARELCELTNPVSARMALAHGTGLLSDIVRYDAASGSNIESTRDNQELTTKITKIAKNTKGLFGFVSFETFVVFVVNHPSAPSASS